MSKIRDMLLARRAEIKDEIDKTVASLGAELKEIDRVLAAMYGTELPLGEPSLGRPSPRSLGDQALVILKERPEGLRMRQIADAIQERFGRDVRPSSMSWNLSHLKRDGRVQLVDDVWKIGAEP